ncbi:MAG: general secretion pathway protein GspL, partial [Thauera sp.]|nr:general secretion pathway protein GspL [Thauera sp.]
MTTTLMLLAGERWPQDPVADWVLLDAARRPLDHGRSDPRHWPAADRHEIVLAGSRVIRLELELPPAPKREQP